MAWIKKWFFRRRKPRAAVFVDYEHWFYSYRTLYGIKPDVAAWRKELEKEFTLVSLEIFADFSEPTMNPEWGRLKDVDAKVVDTRDEDPRRGKDMTDFVMLDRIYRTAAKGRKIDEYILFTGDGHFRSVVAYLKSLGRPVRCYGVQGAYSSMLKGAATESVLFPRDEELYLRCRGYIIADLAYCVDNGRILPTFNSTVEAVVRRYGLESQAVRMTLSRLMAEGYVYQRDHAFGIGKKIKVLSADWERLIREGIFQVEEAAKS